MGFSRRRFLQSTLMLSGSVALFGGRWSHILAANTQPGGATDEEIAQRVFSMVARRGLMDEPVGEIVTVIGSTFTGTPYVPHTLEGNGPERLIVNLREFDCTTFVESVLALARCVSLGSPSFEAFRSQLQCIRYREGIIKGYASRLHYFVDWIADNEKKNVVKDITLSMGGMAMKRPIDFMSSHRGAYRQLGDEDELNEIRKVEQRLSSRAYHVLAKEDIAAVEEQFHTGDIVAIATSTQGLDVSHLGIAARSGSKVRFLHAPLSAGAVQLSERLLHEYVEGIGKSAGIIVARPVTPEHR